MPIQRYRWGFNGNTSDPPYELKMSDGDWCHFEDVLALAAEVADLKAKLAAYEQQPCETCKHHEGLTDHCDLWDRCTDHEHGCRAWKART